MFFFCPHTVSRGSVSLQDTDFFASSASGIQADSTGGPYYFHMQPYDYHSRERENVGTPVLSPLLWPQSHMVLPNYRAAGKYRATHGHLVNFKHLCHRTLRKGKLILMDTQAFSHPNRRNADFKSLSFIYENVFIIVKMLIITAKEKFYQ